MPSIDDIRAALRAREPTLVPDAARRAAVAMVLREREARPQLLFIERAEHEHDPWSGHMAFPGGRVDPGDPCARAAAERETLEEVGLSLAAAERLGRLDDLESGGTRHTSGIAVSAFVYHVPTPGPLVPNYEVRVAFWFPLRELCATARRVEHSAPRAGRLRYPGILVGEPGRHVVWGLTYRFLELFFERMGRPFPDRWSELGAADADAPRAR